MRISRATGQLLRNRIGLTFQVHRETPAPPPTRNCPHVSRMPLPTPVGRQREVLYLPATGHTVVLGTAGSGKTTLAILRSAYLADPGTMHSGPTLLITFTKALVSYLRFLQDRRLDNVVVENYHKFARGYLNSRGMIGYNTICPPQTVLGLVQRAITDIAQGYEAHSFFDSAPALFVDEIHWLEHHGVTDLQNYQEIERTGRSGFRVTRGQRRQIVFEIYQKYRELRTAAGFQYDWDDLASTVLEEFERDTTPRRYRHVIIDEGQDLSPQILRSLVAAVPSDGSVTFFGDVAQQIYGHRLSWRSAGFEIGRVWKFKENYRNTRPIARLALAVARMPYFTGAADLVEPSSPTADGPNPALVSFSSQADEINFVIDRAARAARSRSVAVLFRKRAHERLIEDRLPEGSIRLDGDMNTWVGGPGLRYGTYHAAKGLEFDAVFMPLCATSHLPDPEQIQDFGEDEAAIDDGRLLYVGITRARTELVITHTGEPSVLLPTDDTLYDRSTA